MKTWCFYQTQSFCICLASDCREEICHFQNSHCLLIPENNAFAQLEKLHADTSVKAGTVNSEIYLKLWLSLIKWPLDNTLKTGLNSKWKYCYTHVKQNHPCLLINPVHNAPFKSLDIPSKFQWLSEQ